MRLKGKVAIVTGAGSGMGKEIAKLYAQEGAKVIVGDINQDNIDATVQEIQSAGGEAIGVLANVAQEDDVKKMMDTALDHYGSLHILVNNAGIMDNFTPAQDITDEEWERVLSINLTGPMRTIRLALPTMIKQAEGVIINIASVGGLFGSRAGVAYTSSKHGLIGLTKNIGFQYANLGIRCNAIAPGSVETNIGSSIKQPNGFGYQQLSQGLQLNRRVGQASEIAAVALFLASTESSFVNGTVLTADGGWTAY